MTSLLKAFPESPLASKTDPNYRQEQDEELAVEDRRMGNANVSVTAHIDSMIF